MCQKRYRAKNDKNLWRLGMKKLANGNYELTRDELKVYLEGYHKKQGFRIWGSR